MNATILPEKKKHHPVLLNEIISIITPQYGGTFIDCTFGQGGYTKKILEHKKNEVIAIDRDIESAKIAYNIKKKFGRKRLNLKIIARLKASVERIKMLLSTLSSSSILMRK